MEMETDRKSRNKKTNKIVIWAFSIFCICFTLKSGADYVLSKLSTVSDVSAAYSTYKSTHRSLVSAVKLYIAEHADVPAEMEDLKPYIDLDTIRGIEKSKHTLVYMDGQCTVLSTYNEESLADTFLRSPSE